MIRPSRLVPAALAAVLAVAAASAAVPEELAAPYLVLDIDQGRNAFEQPGCVLGACPLVFGSYPTQLTPAGDRLFFVASDGVEGWQVWVTGGTAESTRAVDVGACADPSILGRFGERAVFHCSPLAANDRVLWITDGTPEGTAQLAELPCGPFGCSFHERWLPPVELGAALYFGVPGEGPGLFELWSTDGTVAGTGAVDLGGARVRSLLVHDGRLHLVAPDASGGQADGPPRLLRREADGSLSELARSCGFASRIEGVTARGDDLYLYSSCLSGLPGGPGISLYEVDLAGGGVREIADRVLPWEQRVPTDLNVLFPPDPPLLAPPALAGDEVYFVRRPNADAELWRLRDGAVEPLATPPEEIERILVAGDRPVFVTRDSTVYGLPEVELVPLGLAVLHPALADFAEPASPGGGLFLAAQDGTIWRTDGTAEGTARVGRSPGGPIGRLARSAGRLYFVHDDGEHDVELWAVEVAEAAGFGCVEDGATLCLAGGRFAVTVAWRDPRSGDQGLGKAVPETADSGFFWFFHPDNLEVLAKVLDAETVNGHHWVFHGSLTDVEYELRVEDLATGAVRTYERPAGSLCGGADAAAFPTGLASGAATAGGGFASGPATPVAASLLLGAGDRFTVAVERLDPATGAYVPATAVEETADSGWAWFFDPANVEVFVKVLDATPVDGRHWVFHGGLTDQGYRVTVVDGLSGAERVYEKAPGSLCGGADTAAF